MDKITEIVYCHNSSNIAPKDDNALKSLCNAAGIKLTLIGIDRIAEDLYIKYPTIAKEHLGLTIDTEQIQTVEDFVNQYDAKSLSATLDTAFMFRKTEFTEMDATFNKANIVLLSGAAGTGKTRLALEYAKKHAEANSETLYCIHDRALPLYEDIKFYYEKPGKYFILVDDANQLSELEHVIEYANKKVDGYQVEILITVRNYALQKVKDDICGIARYEELTLSKFSDEEIKALIKEHYGILNIDYLDRIAQIAEGNARIAMLAGKIAHNSGCLDSINDVSQLYDAYYGTAFRESMLDSDVSLQISAGIVVFLNAIHLDHIEPIIPILENQGISKAVFIENLYKLHTFEIVDICHDKAVRFSEQCFANFILKRVFYDKKYLSLSKMIEACFRPYRQRTVQAVNMLTNVFQSKEIYDYVADEIKGLWQKLNQEDAADFLDYVKAFYPINQTDTLLIVKGLISDIESINVPIDSLNTESGKKYQNIDDDIISILGGFADTENLDAALDLFLQYYLKRPDKYMQFYHASNLYFGIRKVSQRCGFYTQIHYIAKLIEYSDDWNNDYILILFLEVASNLLQLLFSPHEGNLNGNGIVIYHISLIQSDKATEYRTLIWDQLLIIAQKKKEPLRIKKLLEDYGGGIEECSFDIVKNDAPYIFRLMRDAFSPDDLSSCLLAEHVSQILLLAKLNTAKLDNFLQSPKLKIYHLLVGPKWDADVELEERSKAKKRDVREFLSSADDRVKAFKTMLNIYKEFIKADSGNYYEASESINFALQHLADNKEEYVLAAEQVIKSDFTNGINSNIIVRTLDSMLSANKVYELITQKASTQINVWMYAYYHELPDKCIDDKALNGLYAFLQDDSDKIINSSPCRDIDFLDKYLTVDRNVVITASRIILSKKVYSPFMVTIYFDLLFNRNHISPEKVIEKYSGDISLLEDIYIFLERTGRNVDYDGCFLIKIYHSDSGFIKKYAELLIERNTYHANVQQKSHVFFKDDRFIQIIDYIIEEAMKLTKIPSMEVPNIIKLFILIPDIEKELSIRRNEWIRHYIKENCFNIHKMEYLFSALADLSIDLRKAFLKLFITCNNDYEIFKALPLIPTSYSWSGSAVPLYSSWINYLNSLLPSFPGISFINHKKRVEELIKAIRVDIKKEEISNILRG